MCLAPTPCDNEFNTAKYLRHPEINWGRNAIQQTNFKLFPIDQRFCISGCELRTLHPKKICGLLKKKRCNEYSKSASFTVQVTEMSAKHINPYEMLEQSLLTP